MDGNEWESPRTTNDEQSDFHIDGLVVADGRHHRAHELQEDDQAHVRLYLLPLRLRLLHEPLHHVRVLAGVDGQHPALQERHHFLSHCLVLVLRVNVLKDLFCTQGQSLHVVALQPQPGSVVVLIVRDVDVIVAELLLRTLVHGLIAPHIEKALSLHFGYLLGCDGVDAGSRRGGGLEELLIGISEELIKFGEGGLPLPSEVGELVSGLHELLGREHSPALEVLIGGCGFGVYEVLEGAQHLIFMNNQITQTFIANTFANSEKCYSLCKVIPPNKDPQFYKCLDACNSQYAKVLGHIHEALEKMQASR